MKSSENRREGMKLRREKKENIKTRATLSSGMRLEETDEKK